MAPASPSGWHPAIRWRCWQSSLLLAVNWFGDSLDGTLARVRHQERPRYGFYVDHVLDVVGILLLFSGLVAGGFMTPIVGAAFLIAYYLLNVEIALATHTVGTFRISYWKMGPTEMRILLAVGTLQLLRSPDVVALRQPGFCSSMSAGVVAIAALVATFMRRRSRTRGRSIGGSRCLRPEATQRAKVSHQRATRVSGGIRGGTNASASRVGRAVHSAARSILNP